MHMVLFLDAAVVALRLRSNKWQLPPMEDR